MVEQDTIEVTHKEHYIYVVTHSFTLLRSTEKKYLSDREKSK